MTTATKAAASGHIAESELYTLEEVKRRLGMGVHALRQARRFGLRVRRIGRRRYILGRDLMRFVEAAGGEQPAHALTMQGVQLALAGLMMEAKSTPESFADLVAFTSRKSLTDLTAAFSQSRNLLVFNDAGLVFPDLVNADQRDRELGKDASVLTLDLQGIVSLLRRKLAAGGQT